MRNIVAKSSKLLLASASVMSMVMIMTPFAFAANENNSVDNSSIPAITVQDAVVDIGIYEISINRGASGALNVNFDVVNRGATQSNIVYVVDVYDKNNMGTSLAQKVYTEDVLNVEKSETIRKNIAYLAPKHLKGDYIVAISLINTDGLVLARNYSKSFAFDGSGDGILVDEQQCYITVGEDSKKQYSLSQGVDMDSAENLSLHCALKNNSTKDISVTPVFETRYRSIVGKVVSTEKQSVVVVKAKSSFDFVASLPKVKDPQSYNAGLTFEVAGQVVSPTINAHYVLQGESATIQNISLDKESYTKGETAKVTLLWSSVAGNFPGARKSSNVDAKLIRVVSVEDNQGKSCAKEISQEMNSSGGKDDVDIAIANDCQNPIVSAKITNAGGKVLAKNSYSTKTKDIANVENKNVIDAVGGWSQALIYGCAFLVILVLLVYLMKKNNASKYSGKQVKKQTRMKMFLGLLMGAAGMLVSGENAHAASFDADIWYKLGAASEQKATEHFTVDLDQKLELRGYRVYRPEALMQATATIAQLTSCANSFGGKITVKNNDGPELVMYDGAFKAGAEVGFDTFKATVQKPMQELYAPKQPGTYKVTFTLYNYVKSYASQEAEFGACSSYIKTTQGGSKLCGDAAGTKAYKIKTVVIPYVVDANIAATPVEACNMITAVTEYECTEPGKYLNPITGECAGSECLVDYDWTPSATTECGMVNQSRCFNKRLEYRDIPGTNPSCVSGPQCLNPTEWSGDTANVCPNQKVTQTRTCAVGSSVTSESRLVSGTKNDPSCSANWREVPAPPAPRRAD